jgi:hypothetical protein
MRLVFVLALGAAAMAATTSMAWAALDYSPQKYRVAGKHQVYVWCKDGGDQAVTVQAANGDEAIRKAVAGKSNCWGTWQGLVT